MRLRSRTGGTVEWANVDKSSFKLADASGTVSECQNLSASIMGLTAGTNSGEWLGIWSQTTAHGCSEGGYAKPIDALETSEPVYSTTSYRIKLSKQ